MNPIIDITKLSEEEKNELLLKVLNDNALLQEKVTKQEKVIQKQDKKVLRRDETIKRKDKYINNLQHKLSRKDKSLAEAQLKIKENGIYIDILKSQIAAFNRDIYGSKSERRKYQSKDHSNKDNKKENKESKVNERPKTNEQSKVNDKERKTPGRKLDKEIVTNLLSRARNVINIDVDDFKDIPGAYYIGEDQCIKLCASPLDYVAYVYHIKKYRIGNVIKTSVLKNNIFPNSYLTPELLASLAVSKYMLSIPLYRQEQFFDRVGLTLSRQAMSNYLMNFAVKLKPMIDEWHQLLLNEDITQADESTLTVIEEKPHRSTCYMWVYSTPIYSTRNIRIYRFSPSRASEEPIKFYEGFSGIIVSDAYAAYGCIPHVTNAYCFAHLKRKFNRLTINLDDKQRKKSLAAKCEDMISNIYLKDHEIFKESKDYDEITVKRNEIIKPILDELFKTLEDNVKNVAPNLKEAMNYGLNHKEGFYTFLSDGRIPLDNNLVEREVVKPFVIDRKNFLFSNTCEGAKATAITMSVIQTAIANGLNVYNYLVYLITKLETEPVPKSYEIWSPWNENIKKMFGQKITKQKQSHN